jgi:hypothetical protein
VRLDERSFTSYGGIPRLEFFSSVNLQKQRMETYTVEIVRQDVEEIDVGFERLGVEILQVLILGR